MEWIIWGNGDEVTVYIRFYNYDQSIEKQFQKHFTLVHMSSLHLILIPNPFLSKFGLLFNYVATFRSFPTIQFHLIFTSPFTKLLHLNPLIPINTNPSITQTSQ
jgi:hypothetical protein